ncbi:2-oxoglutarate dehydrogenase complex dihydrolipoyllysine-residue succinyltransferase [Candidatus Berkiella aquae]|uniref:Dihydrolipoyllysine-residue succinyltransferase component of 2-oxoglutarate dehydrogenase complex n=1 Tax=Candidatus Berkiella aquae TaxID=295108 RepID=A0A0Q9YP90_9GAMM|nr:2-oxoglutarate dehydrogenase complex dihydrolipoyllysine-residue succinyltransferase [Candidatus Berkiella aquae]MCS5712047.1 2-oxoglutarate dehydrogenase complex dihydrolipoyllysine-residue succinyltransferase [Candidatus Berkiella aquae]
MSIEIKVPVLPESVADATIATWHKKVGEMIEQDENLVDIETDKVVLEVVAPESGMLEKIIKNTGDTVLAEEVIAVFKPMKAGSAPAPSAPEVKPQAAAPAAVAAAATPAASAQNTQAAGPAARRLMSEQDVSPENVKGSGKGGRITTQDVSAPQASMVQLPVLAAGERLEKRVPMTRLRTRIAERLLSAQQNAAILTTFNEVNMQPVMDLRNRYKDQFEKVHGVKLGFMSFFTKAATEALKRFPVVNASIDGKDIVYHGYFDVGVAVSSPRGLVVPILRDVDKMNMAQIEKAIHDLGVKAREGTLGIDEITGGTFTISNGGVFGSLLSTPILNPPQTGILGMHKIEQRPVVENNQIVIRPMMYLAFSYDHRLIDGSESVRFLVTIKELLEDPARLLLDI